MDRFFSRVCFCVHQAFEYASITKQQFLKYQSQQKHMYQIDLLKKEVNKIPFPKLSHYYIKFCIALFLIVQIRSFTVRFYPKTAS